MIKSFSLIGWCLPSMLCPRGHMVWKMEHYLWRNNISVSVIWTSPINIKVNCHVLSQQLNCFRLKFCNCCLWIWRLSTWLLTPSYAVLMIQAPLPLRYHTVHLFHWPSEPRQNQVGMTRNCHNFRQPTVLLGTFNHKICCLKNFKMNN